MCSNFVAMMPHSFIFSILRAANKTKKLNRYRLAFCCLWNTLTGGILCALGGKYSFYVLLRGCVSGGSGNKDKPGISETRFVRVIERSQKLKWQTSGCSPIISGSHHGSCLRNCWKCTLSWDYVGRRDQLMLPGSGSRTEKWLPFNGHSTQAVVFLLSWPMVPLLL